MSLKMNPISEDTKLVPIGELRPGLRDLSLAFIILDIGKPEQVMDSVVRLIKVADKSGSINMSLWGEKGELLQAGDVVRVNKAFTQTFRNSLRLCLSKERQLYKIDEFCFVFSEEPNISEKDLKDFIFPAPELIFPTVEKRPASLFSGSKGDGGLEKAEGGSKVQDVWSWSPAKDGTKVQDGWSPAKDGTKVQDGSKSKVQEDWSPAKSGVYQKQDQVQGRKTQADHEEGQERGGKGQVRRLMLDNIGKGGGFQDERKVVFRQQEGRRGQGPGRQGEVRRPGNQNALVMLSQRGESVSGNLEPLFKPNLENWLRKPGGSHQAQGQGRSFGNAEQQRHGGYNKMRQHGGNQERWGHRHQGKGSLLGRGSHHQGRGNRQGRGNHHERAGQTFAPGKNKPLRCPHCEARFTQREYYIGHLNNFHKEESKDKGEDEKWDSSSASD